MYRYTDHNGKEAEMPEDEIQAIEVTGRCSLLDYITTPAPGFVASTFELLHFAKKRPGITDIGTAPAHYSLNYSHVKSKYLHWDGYVCGGRRPSDEVASLSDVQFASRLMHGDPKLCKKCKVRWWSMRSMFGEVNTTGRQVAAA